MDMGGDLQDEIIMHRFLESRVKNEDREGEEWKGEDQ
jgi:hypothetical protein